VNLFGREGNVMRIACLHTADSNAVVFETAARGTDLALTHTVRAELLREAEVAGGLTPDIAARTADVLRSLAAGVDGVLLTCSTLGPSVDALAGAAGIGVPLARVDAALARQAVSQAGDGRLVVLYAVDTTRRPTQQVFESVPGADPTRIDYRLVDGAWEKFRGGDTAAYLRAIADAADAAFAEGATVVALAQASMAGAASLSTKGVPLTSPAAGLAALAALNTPRDASRV
jgi:hypothetical protein